MIETTFLPCSTCIAPSTVPLVCRIPPTVLHVCSSSLMCIALPCCASHGMLPQADTLFAEDGEHGR